MNIEYSIFVVGLKVLKALDSFIPPSYNPAQQHTKNADEDEYVSKRFSESRVDG